MTISLRMEVVGLPKAMKADLSTLLFSDYFKSLLIKEEPYRRIWFNQVNSSRIYMLRADLSNSFLSEGGITDIANSFTLLYLGKMGLLNCFMLTTSKDPVFWIMLPENNCHVSLAKFGLTITKTANIDFKAGIVTDTVNDLFAINSTSDGNSTCWSLNNLEMQSM